MALLNSFRVSIKTISESLFTKTVSGVRSYIGYTSRGSSSSRGSIANMRWIANMGNAGAKLRLQASESGANTMNTLLMSEN
jgi:hypothetical protein